MRIVVTDPASQDLTDIGLHISQDNPAAAWGLVERILDVCDSLADYPLRYPETEFTGLRKRPYGAYLIFYRVSDKIEIVRFLHSARDWAHLLAPSTD